jgi:asparagine synthase (glutamine-hydrolysing)
MSGITGIYCLDGRHVSRPEVERMGETLTHRGPDGADAWSDGPAGLGCRMLWTTPESLHEKLPLVGGGGDLVITADARIDNRDELIAALGLRQPASEISDSELILRAYERWGEECPTKLIGDFVFAIWDKRRRVMFCARDHLGVKPFFYHASRSLFAFASEIKALFALPGVPRRLNETRMAEFVAMIGDDKAITFYEDILRLPPAHCLAVSEGKTRLWQYWSLDRTRELKMRSDAEYAEAYRAVFTEAVRCRLRSAHPVGALLSGGLDTSSIVCVSRELLEGHGSQPLPTLSAVWEGVPEADERLYINAVVEKGGVSAGFVAAEQLNPLADIDAVLEQQDEMFYGPNIFLGWELHRKASAGGLRVLMNGLHGDYAVSHGISYLSELTRRGHWISAAREARALSRRVYGSKVSARQILWHRGVLPNIPMAFAQRWPFHGNRAQLPPTFSLVNPDLARRTGLQERYRALVAEHGGQGRTAREEQWRDLTSDTIPYFLEMADRVASAFSIEPRYPFCDRRLVEFCMALPGDQRLSGGWSRVIARRAMGGTLPEEVRWREGKADINPHFARTLIARERAMLDEAVTTPSALDEYVNRAALRRVYESYVANNEDYSAAAVVWSAAVMTKWLGRSGVTHTPQMVGGATR